MYPPIRESWYLLAKSVQVQDVQHALGVDMVNSFCRGCSFAHHLTYLVPQYFPQPTPQEIIIERYTICMVGYESKR